MRPQQEAILASQVEAYTAELARRADCRYFRYFPDCVPGICVTGSTRPADHAGLCRVLYGKHMAFIGAALTHRERLFLAANRIGKTQVAGYEVTAHLTGLYPPWWHGRRFDRPTHWWAAGDTMLTTRDILQVEMLGHLDGIDTRTFAGMLPPHLVVDFTRKSGGIAKCVDQVWVRHASGDLSTLEFRSYDQGRRSFQGTAQDGVWMDEEPPDDVYAEALIRTMTTEGMILCTLTPLSGLTPFIQQFIETAVMPDAEGVEVSAREVMAA